jgi:hypothetical protein
MAIDGTKIVDSDAAHDIYNEFIDLYDAGVDIVEIKKKCEMWRNDVFDEVEFEIFITTYALALWETGNLTEEILYETQKTVASGASVKMWLEESGEGDAKKREKELEKFLQKISTQKSKPRKRKKYKQITNFLFEIDDIVTFQLQDKSYRAAILLNIFQYRGKCIYQFTPTSYIQTEKPTESVIKDCFLFVRKIGSGFDRKTIQKMQPGIEKFWASDTSFSIPFTIGFALDGIEHKDLLNFKEKFEVAGKARIKDSFREMGSIGYEATFEEFAKQYTDIVDHCVRIFKNEMVKLKDLEDKNHRRNGIR